MTTLHLLPPLSISARLLPAVRFDTFTVSLDPSDWSYAIDFHGEADGTASIEGSDLRPGVLGFGGKTPDETVRLAMASFLGFVEAYAESADYTRRTGRDGDLADLFPERFGEWAYHESDEIAMARLELDPEELA